eukprot:752299-Hanusia_phi.AAC.4
MVNSVNQVEQSDCDQQNTDNVQSDQHLVPMYNNTKHKFSREEISDLWQEFREFDENKSFGLCFKQLEKLMIARARSIFPHSPSSCETSRGGERAGEVNPFLESPADIGKHAAGRMWDQMMEINPGKKKMSFAEFLEWNERYSERDVMVSSPSSAMRPSSPVKLTQKDEHTDDEHLRLVAPTSSPALRKSFPGFAGIMRKKRTGKRMSSIEGGGASAAIFLSCSPADLKSLPKFNPPPSPTRLASRARSSRNSATSNMWWGEGEQGQTSIVGLEQAQTSVNNPQHGVSERVSGWKNGVDLAADMFGQERFRALTVEVGNLNKQVTRDDVSIDQPYTRSLDSIPQELTNPGEFASKHHHVVFLDDGDAGSYGTRSKSLPSSPVRT